MKVVVGTRGSKLALIQTKWVVDRLKERFRDVDFEIKIITTTGDKDKKTSLDKIGGKGVFVKEIEEELLKGNIDFAVHSMKDMPGELPRGLTFASVPEREDCRDVLLLNKGKSLLDLPRGAKIGTGSKRREYQLRRLRGDLQFLPIRGNIDTRIRKLELGELDGIVLAAAGIKRLGIYDELKDKICTLSTREVLPSPTQGILALETCEENEEINRILRALQDEGAYIQAKCERAFLKGIGGDCRMPIGALCAIDGDSITLDGLLGNEDGSVLIRKSVTGPKCESEELGTRAAKEILEEMDS